MSADLAPIDLAREPAFQIAQLAVRPATRQVAAGERGEVVQPRVLQVLIALAGRRGEVVSRDELVARCWRGQAVSEDAINRCIAALRRLADTYGGFAIDTVARVGYRLTELGASPTLRAPERPSIAVMPFADISPDRDQAYFCDGVVVEIAAAIARFPSLFVIASSSSLVYRDARAGRGEIARELGVRYLLEGSVRKSADRVRIAAELVAAATGAQVWSGRFDATLEDVFRLQDEVAAAVAGQIAPVVEVAEARRGSQRPTADLTAYDLYLRARHLTQGPVQTQWVQAMALLGEAIARDASYALGLAYASFGHALFVVYGWSADVDLERKAAVERGRRALLLARDDAEVLHFAGYALGLVGRDFTTADAMLERALALNPGSSDTWLHSGWAKTYSGRPELALSHFDRSMRLDPRSSWRPIALAGRGWCLLFLGRYAEAIPPLQESYELYPQAGALIGLAAALAHAGRTDEARATLAGVSAPATASFLDLITDAACREIMRSGLALAGAEGS